MDCPFCSLSADRIIHEEGSVVVIDDAYPVNPGHTLIIPKRHTPDWWQTTEQERLDVLKAIDKAKTIIESRYSPTGYNIGINNGADAGQTIFHLHVHLIPRYRDDVDQPEGGVRHVIPAKAKYSQNLSCSNGLRPHGKVIITGGDDPFFPHFVADLRDTQTLLVAVAFIQMSGLYRIKGYLEDMLTKHNTKIALITGTYLDITAPESLYLLQDLAIQWPEKLDVRMYSRQNKSFHPKSYLFEKQDGTATAYVGSSNLTGSAFNDGIEWNMRLFSSASSSEYRQLTRAFDELFNGPDAVPLTNEFIRKYESRRKPDHDKIQIDIEVEHPPIAMVPNEIQLEALEALRKTRRDGNRQALVVLPTGAGKTYLAAFDSRDCKKVLFLAHREEILKQSLDSFRKVRPNASLGYYNANEKSIHYEVIFASIQTISRANNLKTIPRDIFDYIVVDEFHHAHAASYRRLLNYFTPGFLLGLTATPDRMDGGDILALCGENEAYRTTLPRAIDIGILCPFHYYGVPDDVDYSQIPWRSGRFDAEYLTTALATQKRAENALEQYHAKAGRRTIGFCVSTRHADFMAEYFSKRGVSSLAVHSGESSAPRAESLDRLKDGKIKVVFAVDIFNEGLDFPSLDSVLMLRPTESITIWLQQFGRGLRRCDGKERLTVIDYIGNHRSFITKAKAIMTVLMDDQNSFGPKILAALNRLASDEAKLPTGCQVTYDLKALDILRSFIRETKGIERIQEYYNDYKEENEIRPRVLDIFNAGFSPRDLRDKYGSWFGFVDAMGDLDHGDVLDKDNGFMTLLETTPMSKSYKVLVLQAMINQGKFPGAIDIDQLVAEIERLIKRSARLMRDVPNYGNLKTLKKVIIENPINFLCGGAGLGNQIFFKWDGEKFSTTDLLHAFRDERTLDLLDEILEWRESEYLRRPQLAGIDDEISLADRKDQITVWDAYLRSELPRFFGFEFSDALWNQGFVKMPSAAQPKYLFLLCTLEKSGTDKDSAYDNQFLSSTKFQWQSQNRTTQGSRDGELIRSHQDKGITVLLFVRATKKNGSEGSKFTFCGEVDFDSWIGEKPITVNWKLRLEVPREKAGVLGIPR